MNRINLICSICREDLFDGSDTNATQCGHIFHRRCIRYHVHNKAFCPVCRENVNRRELLALFFSEANSNTTASTANSSATVSSPAVAASATSAVPLASPRPKRITNRRIAQTSTANSSATTSVVVIPAPITVATPAVAASVTSAVPLASPQPKRITSRRMTQTCFLNYKMMHCLFCNSKFISTAGNVICDCCLKK